MSRGIVNGNKKAYDDTFPINALTTKKLVGQIEPFLSTWHLSLQWHQLRERRIFCPLQQPITQRVIANTTFLQYI